MDANLAKKMGVAHAAHPEIKVILVKEDLKEFQTMIDKGWKIGSCFPHSHGAFFIMQRLSHEIKL